MGLLVNQPEGLGDIIFSMALVRAMAEEYGDVLWPVRREWVDGLRVAYPDIKFIDRGECKIDYERKDWHDWHGLNVWPLRFAHEAINKGHVDFLRAKYEAYKGTWEDWMENGEFEHNEINEIALMGALQIPQRTRGYVLVNQTYKSDETGKIAMGIFTDPGQPIVEMRSMSSFSLFDWSKVIINASEIHTVGTSILFLIELLKPKCKVYVYPRLPQHKDHRRYDYILRSCDYVLMP